MTEFLSREIYDSAGNVNPEVADKLELAGEIYELALKTISEAANKIAEIRATNAVHMKAISARLERLESK
tara:strand:+ start:144 stop:353 length:210 start_codon:yes stop_codon:yes gene_type:complete